MNSGLKGITEQMASLNRRLSDIEIRMRRNIGDSARYEKEYLKRKQYLESLSPLTATEASTFDNLSSSLQAFVAGARSRLDEIMNVLSEFEGDQDARTVLEKTAIRAAVDTRSRDTLDRLAGLRTLDVLSALIDSYPDIPDGLKDTIAGTYLAKYETTAPLITSVVAYFHPAVQEILAERGIVFNADYFHDKQVYNLITRARGVYQNRASMNASIESAQKSFDEAVETASNLGAEKEALEREALEIQGKLESLQSQFESMIAGSRADELERREAGLRMMQQKSHRDKVQAFKNKQEMDALYRNAGAVRSRVADDHAERTSGMRSGILNGFDNLDPFEVQRRR